jgi:hypothetical protein
MWPPPPRRRPMRSDPIRVNDVSRATILSRALLAAALAIAPVAAARSQSPPPSSPSVVVWKWIKRSYATPEAAAPTIAASLPAKRQVRSGETVASLVQRLYNVRSSSAPMLYNALAGKIADLNNLVTNVLPRPGALVTVPDLPKVLDRPQSGESNGVTLRATGDRFGRFVRDADDMAHFAFAKAADWLVAIRSFAPAQARTALANDPQLQIVSAPIDIRFSSDPAPGESSDDGLVAGDDARLRAAAANAGKQKPILFIVDSTWPDREEEEWARSQVLEGVKRLRSSAGLSPMRPYDAKCGLNVAHVWNPTVGATHAAAIKKALAPYLGLAGTPARVTIVYVPIFKGAPCVEEVLGQLIELNLLLRAKGSGTVEDMPPGTAGFARKSAEMVLQSVGPATSVAGGRTDVAVIQAILDFTYRYGILVKQPVFTSMSFEFTLDSFQPAIPSEYGGLFVVTAGNDGFLNTRAAAPPIVTTKMQFGARAIHPGDMLTVMDFDSSGKQACSSSIVSPNAPAFAVAYPGGISGDCGTSYSTPRVAWLLALREASRDPRPDRTMIGPDLRGELQAGLGQALPTAGGRLLPISALFALPTPPPAAVGPAGPALVTPATLPVAVSTPPSN